MHELAITEGIINIIRSEAEKHSFSRVEEISLAVGEYSGILPECIREFFPIAAADTPAQNAKLVFHEIRAEFECPDCGYKGEIERRKACCPNCGNTAVRMVKGREFYIENLKVE